MTILTALPLYSTIHEMCIKEKCMILLRLQKRTFWGKSSLLTVCFLSCSLLSQSTIVLLLLSPHKDYKLVVHMCTNMWTLLPLLMFTSHSIMLVSFDECIYIHEVTWHFFKFSYEQNYLRMHICEMTTAAMYEFLFNETLYAHI